MNERRPAISVVLASYERAAELDIVLHAFAEQQGPRVEVVVADDGSGGTVGRVDRTVAGPNSSPPMSGNPRKASARRARSIELRAPPAATISSSLTPIASHGRGS